MWCSFQWVSSQLEEIRHFPGPTRDLLANISETPREVYHRTLGKIKEADRDLIHIMFQCVAVASRPLRVEELREISAFEFTSRSIPTYHEDRRWEVDALLSMCSDLLSIAEVDGSRIIQFFRSSMKEYLTSPHISDPSDTTSPLYDVDITSAHTRAAQACLGILLHLDKDVTRDSLLNFPLAEYAAEHWADHARIENVQQVVEGGLKCLFDPNKPHLAISIWIHDPEMPSWMRTVRAEKPSQPSGTPLHYAVLYGLHRIVKYLIDEHQQDIHSRGFDDKSTPLHVASSLGHIEIARILLDYGADAKAQDKHGRTPLHGSVFTGDRAVTESLLFFGAGATVQDEYGLTPLHQACRGGHMDVTRILLLYHADVNAKNKHGWTPLHEASSRGHTELVLYLLEHGADMEAQDRHGWTPYRGASSGGHVELIRKLLENGADKEVPQAQNEPVSCHRALDEGHVGLALVLLEHGVDSKDEEVHGSTLLHKASVGRHAEVVLLLLKRGADVTAQNKLGLTPLHQVSWKGHVEIARILLEHRAPVTVQDKLGWTPLHGASFGGRVELACLLLKYGADTMARDRQGCSPLHHASGRGHVEVVRILLEYGADVGAADKQGLTPLHRALSVGDVKTACVLLERHANEEARDKHGRTPLDCTTPRILEELRQQRFTSHPSPQPETLGAGCCCKIQ